MATQTTGYAVQNEDPKKDPYLYQVGFGNQFSSEAIPGTLPIGQNNPQKCKYGLYAEQFTGTAFVAPRAQNMRTWAYRIRPAVAHAGFTRLPDNPDLEHFWSAANKGVHVSPTQIAWTPFPMPADSDEVDFIDGMKSIAGSGDPTEKAGIAIHMAMFNKGMPRRAYCNNDGDMLIVAEKGRLDIQTEFGKLMVRPGEICVIPRGIRFKVDIPDGPSRCYIQEVYGAHYELPELGPLGANGMANARDFQYPVASFEIDMGGWESVYKILGTLHSCKQEHSPFDVVAYHGNYLPYKYNLERFVNVGSISVDHCDPSIFCVLTVRSNEPGTPLADFLIFSPRWDVASHTYRPPYFHRNAASEFMGLIYGKYGGRSDEFQCGGASYECGWVPHGVAYEEFTEASEMELKPMYISEGSIAIMFESSRPFTLSEYAWNKCGVKHEHNPDMWIPLRGGFLDRIDEVNADLKKLGLATIEMGNASAGHKGMDLNKTAVNGVKGVKANGTNGHANGDSTISAAATSMTH